MAFDRARRARRAGDEADVSGRRGARRGTESRRAECGIGDVDLGQRGPRGRLLYLEKHTLLLDMGVSAGAVEGVEQASQGQ
jgi:hypothetical protein